MRSLTDGPDAAIRLPDGAPSLQSPRSSSKRKVQTFLPSPPPRRSRSSSPSASTLAPTITKTPSSTWSQPSSPATILRPPVPEPLSINSIIRQYCGSRLYVPPLHWTSDHLQLLDCRFALKRARRKGRSKPRRRPAASRDDLSRLTDNVTHRRATTSSRQANNLPDGHPCSKSAIVSSPQHGSQTLGGTGAAQCLQCPPPEVITLHILRWISFPLLIEPKPQFRPSPLPLWSARCRHSPNRRHLLTPLLWLCFSLSRLSRPRQHALAPRRLHQDP